ncbi:unnamed protein product [Moneuplotes crassus]|uniref:Methyltransferase type 11 domain-containing protein n=1 Tax=Euplotes crassus TaxID=5936 RepID=A0AAD2D014_EUPCR|nr:unnamed protein product [Moneuplotes crassus]
MEKIVNKEAEESKREYWNTFSSFYEDTAELVTLQSSMMLYSITQSRNKSRICEVANGCGLAIRMFVGQLMKEGAYMFTSDISDLMNEIFVKRFGEADFAKNEKVKLTSLEETESVDVNKLVSDLGDGVTKKVFNIRASNESLPYPDACFDLYISSLSMMIVDNHHNQLSEAYRVLEEGGTAGFTVWGRKENSSFFTFFPKVCKEAGIELDTPARTNFHLGVDKEALVADVKKAGFKSAKAYYTQINPNFGSPEDYFKFYVGAPGFAPAYEKLNDEEKTKLKETFDIKFEEEFGLESETGTEWEILVVLATK